MKNNEAKVCNLCGRDFDEFDQFEDYNIHKKLGYGTIFDGEILDLHLCCLCMERLITKCEVSPLTSPEDDGSGELL